MKVKDLIKKLQLLEKEGYSDSDVSVLVDDYYISVNDIKTEEYGGVTMILY